MRRAVQLHHPHSIGLLTILHTLAACCPHCSPSSLTTTLVGLHSPLTPSTMSSYRNPVPAFSAQEEYYLHVLGIEHLRSACLLLGTRRVKCGRNQALSAYTQQEIYDLLQQVHAVVTNRTEASDVTKGERLYSLLVKFIKLSLCSIHDKFLEDNDLISGRAHVLKNCLMRATPFPAPIATSVR